VTLTHLMGAPLLAGFATSGDFDFQPDEETQTTLQCVF